MPEAVTFYQKENGQEECRFGHIQELDITDAVRSVTTLVSDEVFDVLKNGSLELAKKEIDYHLNR